MKIVIDPHTLERAAERGATETEIADVIKSGFVIPARGKRRGKAKIYDSKRELGGRYYDQKRVEVIYAQEKETITTVTVYVFYGRWEHER